jgi:hypothetical protein
VKLINNNDNDRGFSAGVAHIAVLAEAAIGPHDAHTHHHDQSTMVDRTASPVCLLLNTHAQDRHFCSNNNNNNIQPPTCSAAFLIISPCQRLQFLTSKVMMSALIAEYMLYCNNNNDDFPTPAPARRRTAPHRL